MKGEWERPLVLALHAAVARRAVSGRVAGRCAPLSRGAPHASATGVVRSLVTAGGARFDNASGLGAPNISRAAADVIGRAGNPARANLRTACKNLQPMRRFAKNLRDTTRGAHPPRAVRLRAQTLAHAQTRPRNARRAASRCGAPLKRAAASSANARGRVPPDLRRRLPDRRPARAVRAPSLPAAMCQSVLFSAWVTPTPPLPRASRPLSPRSARVRPSRRASHAPTLVANARRPASAPPRPSQQQQQQQQQSPPRVHDTTDLSVAFENFEHWPHPQTVPISGDVPAYLHGQVYYRVGPARFEERHKDGVVWKAQQLFDGISKVASFQFDVRSGTVTFRSRFNSTRLIEKIQNTPSTAYRTLSISKSQNTVWEQLRQWRVPTLDPEINLPYANYVASVEDIPGMGLCARTDNAIGQIIHPQTLQPVRQFRFKELHPKLSGFGSLAHGMSDKSSGEYFNVVWDYFPGKVKYHVFRTNKHGRTDILASFRENAYYAHEACITENYIVSVLVPTGINFFHLVLFMCLGNAIEIPDDKEVKFVVVSRKHGGVVGTFTHSFFSFTHVVNAFEREDDIVIDLCRVPKMEDIISSDMEEAKSRGTLLDLPLVRYTLPNVSTGSGDSAPSRATSETIVDVLGEFPSISSKYARKPYRYTYVVGIKEDVMAGSLRKFDLHTGKMKSFAVPGCVLGEPFFVANPQGESEDDGCVVVVALDTVEKKSILLVLDARQFVEVARANLPVAISTGFHGYMRKADTRT